MPELTGGMPLTKSRTSLELMLQLKTLLTLDSKTGWSLSTGAACQTVVREHKGGATAGGSEETEGALTVGGGSLALMQTGLPRPVICLVF